MLTKKPVGIFLILFSVFVLGACSSTIDVPTPLQVEATQTLPATKTLATINSAPTETSTDSPTETAVEEKPVTPIAALTKAVPASPLADVLSVSVSGGENAYQFSVEIHSPDTGCEQYADWWEVVTQDGELIYRRILAHSHVGEQPFTRSGGPVPISADTIVIVRAHMHPGGYGGTSFQGSINGGFEGIQLEPDFGENLDKVDPLPSGCGF